MFRFFRAVPLNEVTAKDILYAIDSIEDKKYFFTRYKHYSKSIRITFTAGLADTASMGDFVLHFLWIKYLM